MIFIPSTSKIVPESVDTFMFIVYIFKPSRWSYLQILPPIAVKLLIVEDIPSPGQGSPIANEVCNSVIPSSFALDTFIGLLPTGNNTGTRNSGFDIQECSSSDKPYALPSDHSINCHPEGSDQSQTMAL